SLDGTEKPKAVLYPPPGLWQGYASVSPDGASIAVIAQGPTSDLVIVPTDATSERRVVAPGAENPSPIWSPDSPHLVPRRSNQLFVVAADGPGPQVLLPLSGQLGLVSWQAVP